MRNPRFPILAIVAYLALVGVLALTSSRTVNAQDGLPPGKDVRVINKVTEPVPVAGEVSINTGSPIPVRDADNPAFQPFQATASALLDDGAGSRSVPIATVPPDKRLVIDHVSALALLEPDQSPILRIVVPEGGSTVDHFIAFTQQIEKSGDAVASLPIHLVADPDGTVSISVARFGGTTGSANCVVSISGHLVSP